MSHIFAQHFVLGVDGSKTHKVVVGRTNTVRKRWAQKLKDLAARNLWYPSGRELNPYLADFNLKQFALSFQRCLFCRPTFLYFRWKKDKTFRPCNRSYFCPFCYARISTAQYRYVKAKLRRIGRKDNKTPLIVTCRVANRFVAAPDFNPAVGCGNETVTQYERFLWGELQRERTAYKKCTKQLQRKTVGSMWRLGVVPQDNGWLIETRQVFLHKPKTKLPFVRVRGSRVAYLTSIKVLECYNQHDTELFNILGQFNRYPQELLSGYDEIVAAYLRAIHDTRTLAGTGLFRKTGFELIQYHKLKDANAKAQKREAEQTAAPETRAAQAQTATPRSAVASTD
jgi:hypothetical protein